MTVRIGSVAALQRVTKRHQAVTGQEPPFTNLIKLVRKLYESCHTK